MKVKSLYIFDTSYVICFDEDGQQIPELQSKCLLALWLEMAEKAGHDLSSIDVRALQNKRLIPRKDSDGTWRIDVAQS